MSCKKLVAAGAGAVRFAISPCRTTMHCSHLAGLPGRPVAGEALPGRLSLTQQFAALHPRAYTASKVQSMAAFAGPRQCSAFLASPARFMTTHRSTAWVDPRQFHAAEAAEEAADEAQDARFGLPNRARGYGRGRPPQLIGRDQVAKLPIQSTISINRIAVVRKGGKVLKFAAIVVVGNGKGLAAIGKGKDKEVGRAVEKAVARAHRLAALHYFELYDGRTIFHDTSAKFKQTKVMVMAPKEGTGLSCNNTLSLLCEAIGIKDLQAKVHGSNNPHNTVAAFWKALTNIRTPEYVARVRGKAVIDYASLRAGFGRGHSVA